MTVPAEIISIVNAFNAKNESFDEVDIYHAIQTFLKDRTDDKKELSKLALPESVAFAFDTPNVAERRERGAYFGPIWQMKGDDGIWREFPSTKHVEEKWIQHWRARIQQVAHPVLRARYADLVWEFSTRTQTSRDDAVCAEMAIDCYIRAVVDRRYVIDAALRLYRALDLALSIDDSSKTAKAKEVFINLVEDATRPNEALRAFEVLKDVRKKLLTEDDEKRLVNALENILSAASDSSKGSACDPFLAKDVALALAYYYRARGQKENQQRVVIRVVEAFRPLVQETSGLVALSWMEELHQMCIEHGLRKEAEALLVETKKMAKRATAEMTSHEFKMDISKEEWDEFITQFTSADLPDALAHLALYFVPSLQKVRDDLEAMSKKSVLFSLFPITIFDQDQPVAKVGPFHSDPEGRLAFWLRIWLQTGTWFLLEVLTRVIDQHKVTAEMLVDFLYESPVFDKMRRPILTRGVNAYLQDDFICAIHVLVPEIEGALRRLLEKSGCATLKRNQYGGYSEKTLNDILRERCISAALTEDVCWYFLILLADPRGWNIRNKVCHGLMASEAFGKPFAARVLHVLLVIAMIRADGASPSDSVPS